MLTVSVLVAAIIGGLRVVSTATVTSLGRVLEVLAMVISVVDNFSLMSTLLVVAWLSLNFSDLGLVSALVMMGCLRVGPIVLIVIVPVLVFLGVADLFLVVVILLSLVFPLLVVLVALKFGIFINHLVLGPVLFLLEPAFLFALPCLVGTSLFIAVLLLGFNIGAFIVAASLEVLIIKVAPPGALYFALLDFLDRNWLGLLLWSDRGRGLDFGLPWLQRLLLLMTKIGLVFFPVGLRVGGVVRVVLLLVIIDVLMLLNVPVVDWLVVVMVVF